MCPGGVMISRRTLLFQLFASSLIIAGLAAPGVAQAPSASSAEGMLAVGGDIPHALTLSAADLKGMPRTTVSIREDGRDVHYEGVLVGEVLRRAGAPLGRDLSGAALATYVLASAKDGYQVLFFDRGARSRARAERHHHRRHGGRQAAVRLPGAVSPHGASRHTRSARRSHAAAPRHRQASQVGNAIGPRSTDPLGGHHRRLDPARASARAVRVEVAVRISAAARAGRQSDDRGQGHSRALPVLRHAALG